MGGDCPSFFFEKLSWAKRVADMPQQLWPVGFYSALGRSKEALSPLGSVLVVCLYFFLVVGMGGSVGRCAVLCGK